MIPAWVQVAGPAYGLVVAFFRIRTGERLFETLGSAAAIASYSSLQSFFALQLSRGLPTGGAELPVALGGALLLALACFWPWISVLSYLRRLNKDGASALGFLMVVLPALSIAVLANTTGAVGLKSPVVGRATMATFGAGLLVLHSIDPRRKLRARLSVEARPRQRLLWTPVFLLPAAVLTAAFGAWAAPAFTLGACMLQTLYLVRVTHAMTSEYQRSDNSVRGQ